MRLSKENYYKTIEYNRNVVYKLPNDFPNLEYYLNSSLRQDLLAFYKYSKSHFIIAEHQYISVIDNNKLTYKVRKKQCGKDITSQHFNLLCAIGLIKKVVNTSNLEIEQNFFSKNPWARRPINAYTVQKYTKTRLKEMERRAKKLRSIGVNLSNFSYNMLCVHGLTALANEVFPHNSRTAPIIKNNEFNTMVYVLDWIIEEQGYCTRQELLNNLADIDKYEFKRLCKIYKEELKALYNFKRPKKSEIEKYNLNPYLSIYTKKETIPCSKPQKNGKK